MDGPESAAKPMSDAAWGGAEAARTAATARAEPGSARSGETRVDAVQAGSNVAGSERRGLWRLIRWPIRFVIAVALLLLGQIALYRFVDPPITATLAWRHVIGEPVEQAWVPLDQVSPALIRAVIASEDARFCQHHGVDFAALREAVQAVRQGQPRGGSTISMQLVKNLLLWPDRSYLRKAMELPLTLALELVWPKRRILEVYLNLAEWGPGLYGIEMAAQRTFGKRASQLTPDEAARLAVVLPNPVERDAGDPDRRLERLAGIIAQRMRGPINVSCLRSGKGA